MFIIILRQTIYDLITNPSEETLWSDRLVLVRLRTCSLSFRYAQFDMLKSKKKKTVFQLTANTETVCTSQFMSNRWSFKLDLLELHLNFISDYRVAALSIKAKSRANTWIQRNSVLWHKRYGTKNESRNFKNVKFARFQNTSQSTHLLGRLDCSMAVIRHSAIQWRKILCKHFYF